MRFSNQVVLILLTAVNFVFCLSIAKDSLNNGLVILFSEAHKIPMVEVKVIIKAGSVYDPKGKEGLANLTARMLLRGTTLHTGDELLKRIEYLGASLDIGTQEDYVEISGRCLSKDLPMLLEIVSECVQMPAFNLLELKKLQRQTYSEISSQMDDPFYVGQVSFRKLIFGEHPLNHDPLGFDTTVNYIESTDLKDFYKQYYAPNNAFIVLVGDFEGDSIKILIDRYFANWQKKDIPPFSSSLPKLEGKRGMVIKRDISQSYIFLGFLGPNRRIPDWLPARMMNYILGGSGLTSRLATEIREKRGLAYSVYSFFDRFNYGGYFVAAAQTKNESANEATELIVREMTRISGDVSDKELGRVRNYYMGNFPLTFDTYREMTNFITRVEIEGLGLDYADRFGKMISAVTIEDIRESGLKYLHPDDFCLVIVGNIDETDIKIKDIEWIK